MSGTPQRGGASDERPELGQRGVEDVFLGAPVVGFQPVVEERFEDGFGDAQGPLGGRGGGEGGGFLGEAGEGELLLCEVEVAGGYLEGGLVGGQWEGGGGDYGRACCRARLRPCLLGLFAFWRSFWRMGTL